MNFSGSDYIPQYDESRLKNQYEIIFELMKDGQYRTLEEIHQLTGYPAASISAQLRNSRKIKFGSHTVNKRVRGDRSGGLFEYSLFVNNMFQLTIYPGVQKELFA